MSGYTGFGGVRLPPGFTTPANSDMTWRERAGVRGGLMMVFEGAIEAAMNEKRTEALGHTNLFGGKQ